MLIRNAKECDFTGCVTVAKRAWPVFERPAVYHLFTKFFAGTSFVCEREGKIDAFLLGFISQVDPADAYIHWIVVDPSAQRQGLASKLYEKFFEAAKRFGARRVRLTVSPDNAPSLAFHKSIGFQPDLSCETIEVGGVLCAKNYNGEGQHMCPFSRFLP